MFKLNRNVSVFVPAFLCVMLISAQVEAFSVCFNCSTGVCTERNGKCRKGEINVYDPFTCRSCNNCTSLPCRPADPNDPGRPAEDDETADSAAVCLPDDPSTWDADGSGVEADSNHVLGAATLTLMVLGFGLVFLRFARR